MSLGGQFRFLTQHEPGNGSEAIAARAPFCVLDNRNNERESGIPFSFSTFPRHAGAGGMESMMQVELDRFQHRCRECSERPRTYILAARLHLRACASKPNASNAVRPGPRVLTSCKCIVGSTLFPEPRSQTALTVALIKVSACCPPNGAMYAWAETIS